MLELRLRRLLCPRTEEDLVVTAAAAVAKVQGGEGPEGEENALLSPSTFMTEQVEQEKI